MKVLILKQDLTNNTILLKSDSFVSAIDLGDKREIFYHLSEGIRLSYYVQDTIYDIECQLKKGK
jgi:hypothetical protein